MSYDNWKTTNPEDKWLGPEPDYNGDDDFSRSIELAYELIRERMRNGGPGWQQKEYKPR